MNPPIVSAAEDFAEVAADYLANAILRARVSNRPVTVALSGGSTPQPVYALLGRRTDLPWSAVHLFQVDERAVPPTDPQSNFGMIEKSLLAAVVGVGPTMWRMQAERNDLQKEAHRYSTLLPARLDLVVLGLGSDGHTASLFPGSDAVKERAHRVVPTRAPDPPHFRLTITRPVLERAGTLVTLVAGFEKSRAVRRALLETGPVEELPGRIAQAGVWVLDSGAAEGLAPHP